MPACPALQTPVEPRRQAISGASVLPSALARRRRLPPLLPFRGSITQPTSSLSTLRARLSPLTRKTRFRLAANLCRAGVITRWVSQEGFKL
jgi:hypothetical protein